MKKFWGVMDRFTVWVMVMVSQVCAYVRVYQVKDFGYVCQSYLKDILRMQHDIDTSGEALTWLQHL